MSTATEIISDAFYEIGAYDVGEPISPEHLTFGLRRLNQIIDQWAARKVYAYNVNFSLFTLTANHQPHLIGPGLSSPDFAAPRPVRIENAAIVITGGIDIPLHIRDDDWWAAKTVKSIKSSVPTDLYYSPDSPSGSLYLWPVPSVAYQLRLEMWVSISQIAQSDIANTFVAPYGYELVLAYTLAEEIAGALGKAVAPDLIGKANRARKAVQGNNSKPARIESADVGTRGSGDAGFNYMTGGPA